jgi:hypothetical protein
MDVSRREEGVGGGRGDRGPSQLRLGLSKGLGATIDLPESTGCRDTRQLRPFASSLPHWTLGLGCSGGPTHTKRSLLFRLRLFLLFFFVFHFSVRGVSSPVVRVLVRTFDFFLPCSTNSTLGVPITRMAVDAVPCLFRYAPRSLNDAALLCLLLSLVDVFAE